MAEVFDPPLLLNAAALANQRDSVRETDRTCPMARKEGCLGDDVGSERTVSNSNSLSAAKPADQQGTLGVVLFLVVVVGGHDFWFPMCSLLEVCSKVASFFVLN